MQNYKKHTKEKHFFLEMVSEQSVQESPTMYKLLCFHKVFKTKLNVNLYIKYLE